jgi:hypothetical protein
MKNSEIVETLRQLTEEMVQNIQNPLHEPEGGLIRLITHARALAYCLEAAALPPNPDVRSIVKAYLEAEGYDGLYKPGDTCRCTPDDRQFCGDLGCRAGYRQTGVYSHFIGPDKPGVQND